MNLYLPNFLRNEEPNTFSQETLHSKLPKHQGTSLIDLVFVISTQTRQNQGWNEGFLPSFFLSFLSANMKK